MEQNLQTPLISVITPVYNSAEFLPEFLDSVLNQTFSAFELILVDDGSSDNSPEICREYAGRDPRVKLFSQKNAGAATARNRAFSESSADWIFYIDSDDTIHPQTLEIMYHAARSSDVKMVITDNEQGLLPPESFAHPADTAFETFVAGDDTVSAYMAEEPTSYWYAAGKLIARVLVQANPFDTGRYIGEDTMAVCNMLAPGVRYARTAQSFYFYRTNPTSIMSRSWHKNRLQLFSCNRLGRLRYQRLKWKNCRNLYVRRQLWCLAHEYHLCRNAGYSSRLCAGLLLQYTIFRIRNHFVYCSLPVEKKAGINFYLADFQGESIYLWDVLKRKIREHGFFGAAKLALRRLCRR